MKIPIPAILALLALPLAAQHPSVALTWTNGTGGAIAPLGTNVYRSLGPTGLEVLVFKVVGPTLSAWLDLGAGGNPLAVGNNYCYRVRAYATVSGSEVESQPSNQSCALVPFQAGDLPAPTGLNTAAH